MPKRLKKIAENIYYFFPVQLLITQIKENHILLTCWIILFAIVTGNFGNYLGIPYLFLDPEYLSRVNFTSFFIIGVTVAGFTIAFHITTYINEGHKFSFVGVLRKPFTKFSLNNSIIPIAFLITYIVNIIRYQLQNEFSSKVDLAINLGGLMLGYISMTIMLFGYFLFTNNDIFKYVVCKLDEKLKQNIKATRASALNKLDIARKKQVKVNHYFSLRFKIKKANEYQGFYDKGTILQVFDQNHFNLVVIELLIFALLLILGIFKDYPLFQLPAAASFILFLTVFVMFSGAFSYWFGKWSATAAIILLLFINFLMKNDVLYNYYKAYGIDYSETATEYSIAKINELNSIKNHNKDAKQTIQTLNNWKSKFTPLKKPKMAFVCASGGGQRSALWTLKVLQSADSATGGALMKNTILMTGASGGLIGAAYFRELILMKHLGEDINPYSSVYQKDISNDNLNTIIFSLLANDLFVGLNKFEYMGFEYPKDRIYSFEEQLNRNTRQLLDKPISDYSDHEANSTIPMMILAPTIINDGRKLFISPRNVSFMSFTDTITHQYNGTKINGIDFQRLFSRHGAQNLRFLSALRMNATFPYITPTTTLPSTPPMEIMDAGISDNFGISDAIRFLYVFKDWVRENTSGVVIISVRDSQKNHPIAGNKTYSLFEKFSTPISSIYNNFESLQDIKNDSEIDYAKVWFDGKIFKVDFEYNPSNPTGVKKSNLDQERASLNWRLTSREKKGIVDNINSRKNQEALHTLQKLLK